MADVNINVAQMEKWQVSVKQELEEVDKTLDEVSKVCKECSGDDTLYGEFQKLGEGIANAYIELAEKYRETMDVTEMIVSRMKQGISNVGQLIKKMAENFHR
jgi:dsDNA-specific endonuclease/ATPase MutS2